MPLDKRTISLSPFPHLETGDNKYPLGRVTVKTLKKKKNVYKVFGTASNINK